MGRYALWLHFHELGIDPERLDLDEALAFCEGPACEFLVRQGLPPLSRGAARRLCRAIDAYDPGRPTPDELVARWEREG